MFLPSTRRVSAVDFEGRILWIADAHHGDGKRFVVRADEKLTAFVELERAIYELAVDAISGDFTTPLKLPLCSSRLDHVAGPAMRRRRNFSTRNARRTPLAQGLFEEPSGTFYRPRIISEPSFDLSVSVNGKDLW